MKHSTLGLLLNLGESFTSLGSQNALMIRQNVLPYAKAFKQVYIFTYRQEKINLPSNCHLITPPLRLHRYIYALLLPIIHYRTIRTCNLMRCFQLGGTMPALLAKLLYGSKFVFNYGYDYVAFARIEGKPLQALFFTLLKPLSLKFATGVIVKSKSLLRSTIYYLRSTIYLPNGVDTHQFHPITKSGQGILFVGRLEPQKNLLPLLDAVSHLPHRPQLTLVGDGSLKTKIRKRAQKLKINLKLQPAISHNLLPQIYRRAAIFVLPSLIEGSPKVLLEAMASGLPCVASAIPAHRDIITHHRTGLLCQPTTQALSHNLAILLNSVSLRRRLGNAARQHVAVHFSASQIISREINFLHRL